MRTGVLGGTFDPPHLGHVVLGAAARRALSLDRVLFVPAGEPWRKAAREVTPGPIRLEMIRAAVAHLAWADVSAVEVEREGPTYSSETIEALAAGGGEWWFLLGHDALVDLPHWHDPRRLVAAARLGLAARPPAGFDVPAAALEAVPGIEERIDAVPMPPLLVSSSELRARIAEGRSTDVWLPEPVRAIIEDLGLYRAAAAGV